MIWDIGFVRINNKYGKRELKLNFFFESLLSPGKRRRYQRSEALAISQMVRENNADKELKTRLYVTICCSMMGTDFLTRLILAIQF